MRKLQHPITASVTVLCIGLIGIVAWLVFSQNSMAKNQDRAAASSSEASPSDVITQIDQDATRLDGMNRTISLSQPGQPAAADEPQVVASALRQGASVSSNANNAEVFPLPFSWEGGDTVDLDGFAAAAPPLQIVSSRGDFEFTHIAGSAGDSIRVLLSAADDNLAGPSFLQLAWTLPDEANDVPVPAGRLVTLTGRVRAYSPPDGVHLSIWEGRSGQTQSSSVAMDGIEWSEYSVTRQLDPGAEKVEFGLQWTLPSEDAWVEFADLRVQVFDETADPADADLSPTDTATPDVPPTPPPTPTATPTLRDEPTATPRPTETPVVVTSTPTPVDVFAAATLVAQITQEAASAGTATPTPVSQVTATYTPTPIVITETPTPENEATAQANAWRATAIAFTTGTPTPYPAEAVVLVATGTPLALPRPTSTPTATRTPTPIFVYLEDIPPTTEPTPTEVFPQVLVDKILFLGDSRGRRNSRGDVLPDVHMMNPDGSGLAILTSRLFYERAEARDAYSADKRFRAFALKEVDFGKRGNIQIYYEDLLYETVKQTTFFGAGTAWAPSWSPTSETIVFVSSESRNDELWVVRKDEWPALQLTKNEWEWDKHPSWSPDGSQIIFSSNRGSGINQLWIMDGEGRNVQQLTSFPWEAWDPVWVKYPDS